MVPGHGPVTDYDALRDYVAMLIAIRERLVVLITEGHGLEQISRKSITAEWDERFGDPSTFLNRAYYSLTDVGNYN